MADTIAPNPSSPNGPNMAVARQTRSRRFQIFGGVLVVALIGGGLYWWLTRNEETTDDAFVEADVVTIAPRVDGSVVAVNFTDNQRVEAGQILVQIDPSDYQVAVDSARAALADAEAQRSSADADLALTKVTAAAQIEEAKNALAQIEHEVGVARQQADATEADAVRAGFDVKRYEDLVKTNDASRQRYEQAVADARSSEARLRGARASVTVAEAQVAQAQARLDDANAAPQRIAMKEAQLAYATASVAQAAAALHQAELNLEKTKIASPVAGRVTKRTVEPGDYLMRGQTLANLVADPPWVVANFKETQLARMRPGQHVRIGVDAIPGLTLAGHVESFQPGSGSRFTLLPPENATGNYVKVVQRIPVKIVFDGLDTATMHRLAPGMSVAPVVDVGSRGTPEPAAASK